MDLDLKIITEYAQIGVTILTAFIAFLVYRVTKTIARIEHMRYLNDNWQQINLLLINDKSSAEIFYDMRLGNGKLNSGQNKFIDLFKREQIIAMLINNADNYFNSMRMGHIDKKVAENYINAVARFLRSEREFVLSIIDHTYQTEFGDYLRKKLDSKQI